MPLIPPHMITARAQSVKLNPSCFRAERGQCDSGKKVAKENVKTDPMERIARTEGNHIRAPEVDRVAHRMYKVHHFLIGSFKCNSEQSVSPVKMA